MNNKSNILMLVISLGLVFVSACAERKNLSPLPTISEKSKADINKPVDCRTARQDIKILEDEKASVGKQILSGVRSVAPIPAVIGILSGDYRDRVRVAVGTYNNDISDKIDEIKKRCALK